ncbi:cytochrome b [Roseibium aggregatum]|uniref:Cytochrome b n=1 Tax=Roseibium aggregatum TaxID=187304 RepID=A0A939J379_9HYPH|nr:cytochrome b [Roseibium aggregatum]MBN9670302.1 cytochrome b [Roseibium aggregatum]
MLRNTLSGYGLIAILFHWTMALMIVFMLALGLYMKQLPLTEQSTFQLFQLHKSIGFVVLALGLLRILWRIVNPVPRLPAGMAGLEKLAAHAGHFGLYALIFAMPVTGWFMVSASPWGIPTILFNIWPVPHLPVPSALGSQEQAESFFKLLHEYGAYLLIALVIGHVAAALKHHFIARDDTLKRMTSTAPAKAKA